MPRPCSNCEATPAPYGYGLAGTRREKPEGKRGYIFVCGADDCHAWAAEKKRKAEGGR